MAAEGCRAICVGIGLHYPYYINTAFPARVPRGKTKVCFSPSQERHFMHYLGSALVPALASALGWLDAGHRLAFSVSGLLVEQLPASNTEARRLLERALSHENSEVLGQTYYHSVAALFSDTREFSEQVASHADLMEEISGKRPGVFENTEFAFSPEVAALVRGMGFSALYSEGYDHLLSVGHPNALYTCGGLPVLLRNCRLSDDLAFRFFDPGWDRYPLSATTFADWIAATPGDCIHVFIDARTFSPARSQHADFQGFFAALPDALRSRGVGTLLPSDCLRAPVRGEIPPGDLCVCQPGTIASPTGIQNILQQSAFWCLEEGGRLVARDREAWRRLQATDHFHRMALCSASCGRQVPHSTNEETCDYFAAYMRVLEYLELSSAPHFRSRSALRALRCLPPERAFHFHTGTRYAGYSAHSLSEFGRILEFVPAQVYSFHHGRGDFSRWVKDVLGDRTLSRALAGCRTAAEARETVQQRIGELWRRLG